MEFHATYYFKLTEDLKANPDLDLNDYRRQFLSEIPTVTMSADEITRRIQTVQPGYYFQTPTAGETRARTALSDAARNASFDVVETMLTDTDCLAGKSVFSEDKRETGYHIGSYIKNQMTDDPAALEELRALAKEGSSAENYVERKNALQRKVFEHLAAHLDEYLNDINGYDDRTLVEKWKEIMPILKLGDVNNSVGKASCFTEEEKTEYYQKLGPLQTLSSSLSKRMDTIASPVYAVMDPNQLKNVSPKQATELQQAVGNLYDDGQPESAETETRRQNWNPFNDLSTAHGAIASKVTETIRQLLNIDPADKRCKGDMTTDLEGNNVDIKDELLGNRRPVYVLPNGRPDLLPVMAYVDYAGELHIGEQAAEAFINDSPKRPQEPKNVTKPTGLWDKICKYFGWESLRSESARQYDAAMGRYQAEMSAYDKALAASADNDKYRIDLATATKDEKETEKTLKTMREKMISSFKHMSVEEYTADMNAKRKEDAVHNLRSEKNNLFDDKCRALKKDQSIPKDKKLTNAQESLVKTQVRENSERLEKASSALFKGNADVDAKANYIATGIVCRLVDNCILDGLNAKLAQTAPTEEFEKMLQSTSADLTKKTNGLIEKLASTDAAKRAAAELSQEDIERICSPTLSAETDTKIKEVMETYNLVPTNPSTDVTQPTDPQLEAEHTNEIETPLLQTP